MYIATVYIHAHRVELLIKDTPNKGHLSIKDTCFDPMLILSCIIQPLNKGHLCIKDNFHGPSVSFIQRFHCSIQYTLLCNCITIDNRCPCFWCDHKFGLFFFCLS